MEKSVPADLPVLAIHPRLIGEITMANYSSFKRNLLSRYICHKVQGDN